jgi:hypothetical protein
MVSAAIGVLVTGMAITFVVMAGNELKANQSQVTFNHMARYGRERVAAVVRTSSLVTVSPDGSAAQIGRPDGTSAEFYFEDSDGRPETIEDNAIWYDPDPERPGDEVVVLRYVTPTSDRGVFSRVGAALQLRCRIGDASSSSKSNLTTGPGSQGVDLSLVVAPRNAGQLWASEIE